MQTVQLNILNSQQNTFNHLNNTKGLRDRFYFVNKLMAYVDIKIKPFYMLYKHFR